MLVVSNLQLLMLQLLSQALSSEGSGREDRKKKTPREKITNNAEHAIQISLDKHFIRNFS